DIEGVRHMNKMLLAIKSLPDAQIKKNELAFETTTKTDGLFDVGPLYLMTSPTIPKLQSSGGYEEYEAVNDPCDIIRTKRMELGTNKAIGPLELADFIGLDYRMPSEIQFAYIKSSCIGLFVPCFRHVVKGNNSSLE
ncbi:hypothetical protein M8C21_002542, partial [Ambrosia artemisiifolia]